MVAMHLVASAGSDQQVLGWGGVPDWVLLRAFRVAGLTVSPFLANE